jgi:hypothetical protein
MKRLTISVSLILLSLTTLTFAQQRGPKAFVPEPSFDMGYIPQRAKVGHTFWVYNIGTDSLNIKNIQVTCGCTKASNSVGMVAVNDSVPIEIVFDSGTRRLAQNKRVTVQTNDPGTGSLSLQFTGYVFTPEEQNSTGPVTYTANKQVNATTDDLGRTFDLEYRNNSQETISPTVVRHPDELVTVSIPKNQVPPGGTGKITITLAESVKQKNQHKSVTFQFNDTNNSRYTIPVRLAESISSLKAKTGS